MVECGLRGLHLGLLFAMSAAASEFTALPLDGGDEIFGMIGAFLPEDAVERGGGADGLDEFLELAFGIGIQRTVAERFEVCGKESCGKALRGVAASVEMDGTGDGFERIGEGGVAITATIGFFATA